MESTEDTEENRMHLRILAIEADAILDRAGFNRWGRPKREISPGQIVFDYRVCNYRPTINEVLGVKKRVASRPHYRA